MFVLTTLKDKIKVSPEYFQEDMMEPVINEIHRLYANKVIAQVGLCVAVHQIVEMGDMFIYPNEGAAYIVTVFNLIVFRPFVDEVMVGTIHKIDETGVVCSVGFFDEIFIPASYLPIPSTYDSGEKEDYEEDESEKPPPDPSLRKWVWDNEGDSYDMVVGDEVRFRAMSVRRAPLRLEQ
jgi:DNA-directed RNA polymerase III subunit RPC8